MPTVSVPGAGGALINLPFSSSQGADFAATLLQAVYAASVGGTLEVQDYTNSPMPIVPNGWLGEEVIGAALADPLNASVAGGYQLVVDQSAAPATVGGGVGLNAQNETVLAGNGGLTFNAGTGSGSFVSGGGNNLVTGPSSGGGSWNVYFDGTGSDTLFAGSGTYSVTMGTGSGLAFLGAGADTVTSYGADTIIGTTGNTQILVDAPGAFVFAGNATSMISNDGGAATISAGHGQETIFANASGGLYFANTATLTFVNGSGASTFVGGGGNDTLFGGSGSGTYFVGSGNFIFDAQSSQALVVGGPNSGAAVVFSGFGGDVTLFSTTADNQLIASGGADVLNAAGAFSNGNVLFSNAGNDTLIGGPGNDVFVASGGNATMQAGSGANQFIFQHGQAGGNDLIMNFNGNDGADFFGYGGNAVANIGVSAGSTIVTLTDGTRITFLGLGGINPGQLHTL
jgi:Ca2+-binding RTX toxin-like protein